MQEISVTDTLAQRRFRNQTVDSCQPRQEQQRVGVRVAVAALSIERSTTEIPVRVRIVGLQLIIIPNKLEQVIKFEQYSRQIIIATYNSDGEMASSNNGQQHSLARRERATTGNFREIH